MKLTDVGCDDLIVEKYIRDDKWVMQQKFDGTRIIMIWNVDTEEFVWANDGVKPVSHAAAKLKLPALEEAIAPILRRLKSDGQIACKEFCLDGELLIRTGEYVVWDLLQDIEEAAENDPFQTWEFRHMNLRALFEESIGLTHELLKMSPTAYSAEEKLLMWSRIKMAGVEGAVSKHVASRWVPGSRTREWVKHKLVKSADLVVMDTRRVFKEGTQVVKEGSATLGYYEHGDGPENPPTALVKLCGASLIGKDLTIDNGDVVEIEYLYLEPGGSPVQPRITRKRHDKAAVDCDLLQFPEYSRKVLR